MPQNLNISYTLSIIMTRFKAKVKKWGNSLGIVIPKEIVEKVHVKNNQILFLDVRSDPLKEAFGSLKAWKIDSQKMKDELRKEWH